MRKLFVAALCSILVSLSFGQDMVKVEGGTFMMGSTNPLDQAASPVHSVTVGSFYIEKYEVTFEKWTTVRAWGLSHGYTDIWVGESGGNPVGSNNPVTHERWWDIIKWCNARSEMEGYDPVFYKDSARTIILRTGMTKPYGQNPIKWSANGYRLPTEAEWEFAARGGKQTHGYLYSGSNTPEAVGWYANTTVLPWLCQTHSVGQKAANELGLYDMSGNVWEECCDYWGLYTGEAQTDPTGPPTGQNCVIRGGSAQNDHDGSLAYRMLSSLADGSGSYYGFRCARAPKITILKPRFREVVPSNSTYYIKWKAPGVDSIKIEYSNDDGKTYTVITPSVSVAADSFAWKVPEMLSSKCMMVMREINNPSDTTVNTNFRIKGYVLTRFKANGDYEKFDPALHAWQFKNDSTNMWPLLWYNQFNYRGIDPYTNQPYPSRFIAAPIQAKSSSFVDWPLFVRTFNPSVCYKNVSKAVYSPTAERLWARFKYVFNGSCFGFSLSCLWAFDRPEQFRLVYPEVGNFVNIHDLQLNDSLRRVINQLYEHQVGRQHLIFKQAQFNSHNVRETLKELKSYFLSDSVDHRSLFIIDKGQHSIVPYRLEKYPNHEGYYILRIYDSNSPSGVSANGSSTAAVLDSVHNIWSYDPLNWVRERLGIILSDPVSQYLSYPLLWDARQENPSSSAISLGKTAGDTTYLSIYNTISANIAITNSVGQSIGFHDSVSYNTLGDGIPIIPENSVYQPPIGYFVPDDKYSIQMSAFTDSSAAMSVLNQTGMFNFWRSDAVNSQTDRLSYDGGMGFGNRDAQTKSVNLEAITRLTDSERDFQILNCAIVQNDSVRIVTPDSNRVAFINLGPLKTYDLNVVLAGESSSGQFTHKNITVPAHSTHYIVPNWQDIDNQLVKIYQDAGNTGTISDSLLVTNQATGIEDQSNTGIPGKYSLNQNYPNPFNPTTTIRYGLPHRSQVTLAVFNTLGQQVEILQNGEQDAGFHEVQFDGSGLASGIYFYQIKVGDYVATKKMLLLK